MVQRDRISAFIDLSVVGVFKLLPSGTWILSGWLSFSGVLVVKVSVGTPHAGGSIDVGFMWFIVCF